jgi:hypothetical protein
MGWSPHDASCGRLHTQTEGGRTRRDHIDPENGQGREREDTVSGTIEKSETKNQQDAFTDVDADYSNVSRAKSDATVGKLTQVEDETLDVIEDTTSFADG